MSEIVISDAFDSCFFDIRIKSMGERVFVDRGISSEKEWCFALVVCKSRAQRGADRGISDLLVLRCRDLIGRTVKGFAAIGFIEEDRGGFDIRRGEGKNLSFSSAGKKRHGKDHFISRIVNVFDKFVKLVSAPKLHLVFGDSAFWLFDEFEFVWITVSAFRPGKKRTEMRANRGKVRIAVGLLGSLVFHCPKLILPLIEPFFCKLCNFQMSEHGNDHVIQNVLAIIDG